MGSRTVPSSTKKPNEMRRAQTRKIQNRKAQRSHRDRQKLKVQLAEAIMECVQRYKFDDDRSSRSCINGSLLSLDSDQEGEDSEAEETAASAVEQFPTQDASIQVTANPDDVGSSSLVQGEQPFTRSNLTSFPTLSYDLWPYITNYCHYCGFTPHHTGLAASTAPTITPADTVADPWLEYLEQPIIQEAGIKQEYTP